MSVYSIAITVYVLSFFTPTIVHELGFSAANAQLLSAPPFVCGSILAVVVGINSDRVNLRGPFVVAGATVGAIGYIIAYTTSTPGPGYVASVLAASGTIPLVPVALAWAGGNSGGNMKRGVVIAMVIGLANLGGYVFFSSAETRELTTRTDVTLQYLLFVYLLSTTSFSQGPRHSNRLPWYEVCTGPSSSRGRTEMSFCTGQYRVQLRPDVDVQEAE